ncbi:MAG: DUF3710 domain-containing protein [Nocardioides sp.]
MFGRKRARADDRSRAGSQAPDHGDAGESGDADPGPFSVEQLRDDGITRLDLGSLLIPAPERGEVRLQVDQATEQIRAVQIVDDTGGVEVRAFAAPRNGDLWASVREQIAGEARHQGASIEVREGRFGVELIGTVAVAGDRGDATGLPSRLVGVNGDRWLLRGMFLGAAATDGEAIAAWDEVFASLGVRRGDQAMPAGEALPLVMPRSS